MIIYLFYLQLFTLRTGRTVTLLSENEKTVKRTGTKEAVYRMIPEKTQKKDKRYQKNLQVPRKTKKYNKNTHRGRR